MYKRGDFHIHSSKSDGELRPREIVILAKEMNLDIISITDHNKVSGNEEAIEIGELFNIKVVPGIELSTRYKGNKVHILGYFFDDNYKNIEFVEMLNNINKRKFKKINKSYYSKLMLNSEGGKLTVKSGIDFLHYFNAKVILAHPVFLQRDIFLKLIEYNFDGIEAKYYKNKKEDTEFFINMARKKNIIYTAGSDFHKLNKIDKNHGNLGDIYLEYEELESINQWISLR